MKKKLLAVIALVAALCVACVGMSGCVNNSTPANNTSAYQFKTGIPPPPTVSNLMKKHGTVVLYFTVPECWPCVNMTPKMADLQSQYEGAGVTFVTIGEGNDTSNQIFRSYGIQYAPAVVVVRGDGAVAILKPDVSGDEVDINIVRSAIDDAQRWESAPIPTETPSTAAPPTAAPSTHDAFLEQFANQYKNEAQRRPRRHNAAHNRRNMAKW